MPSCQEAAKKRYRLSTQLRIRLMGISMQLADETLSEVPERPLRVQVCRTAQSMGSAEFL